ncbi:MAG: hypothetical protein M3N38_10665 [Pseudomonadota bacterium]|nr:hypothetical protein [Pseudomonadota bacterium]
MDLSPPKTITFIIAIVLAALGLAGHYGLLAATAPHAFLLLVVGFVVLALGNLVRGL